MGKPERSKERTHARCQAETGFTAVCSHPSLSDLQTGRSQVHPVLIPTKMQAHGKRVNKQALGAPIHMVGVCVRHVEEGNISQARMASRLWRLQLKRREIGLGSRDQKELLSTESASAHVLCGQSGGPRPRD